MSGFFVPQSTLAGGTAAVDAALAELTRRDLVYLRTRSPNAPALYSSGVRYVEEPITSEYWRTIPEVLAARQGDCEDLCAWRAAELQYQGLPARAFAVVFRDRLGVLYHVLVQTPQGVEDPSRVLGMRA